MGILANVLPGVRDVRAPILAGYSWLLFGWLLLGDALDRRPGLRYVHDVVVVAHRAGPVWTAAAVSVVAYLVGLLSRDLSSAMSSAMRVVRQLQVRTDSEPRTHASSWGEFAARLFHRYLEALILLPGRLIVQIVTFGLFGRRAQAISIPLLPAELRFSLDRGDAIVRGLVEDRAREAEALLNSTADGDADDGERRTALSGALRDLAAGLQRELGLPATLLVGDQPELFAEADRIRAESELRVALAPPLLALATLLVVTASRLWLLALIPIGQLLVQGINREDDARRLIGSALLFGRVESAAVKRFDSQLDRFRPTEAQGDGVLETMTANTG